MPKIGLEFYDNAQKNDLIIYYRNGLKNNTVTKPSADKQALSKLCGISLDNIVYQKGLVVNRSWLAHIQAENSIVVIFWLQKSALPLKY